MESIVELPLLRITEKDRNEVTAPVTREYSLTVVLDGQELVNLLCTPRNLDYLAIGFLVSEGLVESKSEIKKLLVDEQKGTAWIETVEDRKIARDLLFKKRFITSGGGTVKGASFQGSTDIQHKVQSQVGIRPHQIFKLVGEFQNYSPIFQRSHGVHSAALCDTERILVFADDLGRHNAIDKVFGECILKDIATEDRIVITTGRIPSEQLLKVAKRKVPVMVSLTVPTDLGVKLANDYGITLIGSVRGNRMDVFTHRSRVWLD